MTHVFSDTRVTTASDLSHLFWMYLISGSNPEGSLEETINETRELVKPILEHIPVIVVTLGEYGVLVCRRGDGPLPSKDTTQVGFIWFDHPIEVVFNSLRPGDILKTLYSNLFSALMWDRNGLEMCYKDAY